MLQTYGEGAREVPIIEESDVVVCGAGPAGVAAALAAARAGARTRLLEVHGCLGGIWTAGLLSWIIDHANKPGLMAEITAELERRGARATPRERADYAYDPEAMKVVLEEMCLAAGVAVQLHTRVVAAARDGAGRLALALTESKSGRQAGAGRVFVDAAGGGDLGAHAGCGFDLGRESNGECQPMSLMALVAGVRAEEIADFYAGGSLPYPAHKERFLAEIGLAGISPSYAAPTLFRIRDDLFAMMANHEYGVSALDAGRITEATLRARAEVHRIVDGLRGLGGAWAGMRIVATGAQIGVREGRRIHGRYCVSVDDMLGGARHADAVCRVTFGIDVHTTNPAHGKTYGKEGVGRTQAYDIPLRALIARDVEGLLLAGRCISGDFLAHSSYRVTGNSVALGQAAGTLAALAARAGRLPQDVPWLEVRRALFPE